MLKYVSLEAGFVAHDPHFIAFYRILPHFTAFLVVQTSGKVYLEQNLMQNLILRSVWP